MLYSVYILYSQRLDKYYIGSSKNPKSRLKYHNMGKKGWTKRGVPWELVFQQEFQDKKYAMGKEMYIKKQKSKIFIKNLISGKYSL